jgi:hypothetical protein
MYKCTFTKDYLTLKLVEKGKGGASLANKPNVGHSLGTEV